MRWATMTLEWGVKQYCAAVIPTKDKQKKKEKAAHMNIKPKQVASCLHFILEDE